MRPRPGPRELKRAARRGTTGTIRAILEFGEARWVGSHRNRSVFASVGIFVFVFGIYLFANPGRIDMIDGQHRFEVSKNILAHRGPILDDHWLLQDALPQNPKTHQKYSFYTAPPSLAPIPLLILSRAFLGIKAATDRFTFSVFDSLAGATIAPLLMIAYRRLGVKIVPSLACCLAFCFASMWWPGSETVFDQCQHGVTLFAMFLCAWSACADRGWGSALGVGILGAILFNYRVPFVFLLPLIPVYWWYGGKGPLDGARIPSEKFAQKTIAFGFGVLLGVVGYVYYNWIRFGQVGMPSFSNPVPLLGNPITGFLTLAVSPGKGFLWFSPILLLTFLGWKGLVRRETGLAWLIAALIAVHVLEMSCLSFASGDWCWGPRYLLPIMPLCALAFPFLSARLITYKFLVPVFSIGLAVQLLALSVDHHRFFYDRRLRILFWYDGWAYFRFSQLAARPAEIWGIYTERDITRPFVNSNPYNEATYCPFGPPWVPIRSRSTGHLKLGSSSVNHAVQRFLQQVNGSAHDSHRPATRLDAGHADSKGVPRKAPRVDSREWVKQYKIFNLPRPWWGWIDRVPPEQRPIDPRTLFAVCSLLTVSGGAALALTCYLERRRAGARPSGIDLDARGEGKAT